MSTYYTISQPSEGLYKEKGSKFISIARPIQTQDDISSQLDLIKKKYAGKYLEYHDERLPSVIEGYLLQAVFYYLTGDPFCEDQECRLFNAHWQKDLIHSQLESGNLCVKHKQILQRICEMT